MLYPHSLCLGTSAKANQYSHTGTHTSVGRNGEMEGRRAGKKGGEWLYVSGAHITHTHQPTFSDNTTLPPLPSSPLPLFPPLCKLTENDVKELVQGLSSKLHARGTEVKLHSLLRLMLDGPNVEGSDGGFTDAAHTAGDQHEKQYHGLRG